MNLAFYLGLSMDSIKEKVHFVRNVNGFKCTFLAGFMCVLCNCNIVV